jgi:CelD/BcsL family acetyltransferase involved in cellulose biosynthesis
VTAPPETRPFCTVLDHAAALRDCRDELARLAEMSGAASSIVQHPDWLLFELRSGGPAVVPCVVVARDKRGRLLGYAPFLNEVSVARIAFGARHVPLYRGRILRMLGSGVVALPEQRALAEEAISASLKEDQAVRVLRIQETELPNPLATALSRGAGRFNNVRSHLLDQVNWTIQPQESLAAYLAQLGSRRKKLSYALRNAYKKLGPDAHLRVVEAPGDIDDYCRLVNEVYARTWHATARSIDWELPVRRELFRQLARAGQVSGHLLMLGTRPIAYVHGYRLAGRYLLDDAGYDEEFAPMGVGSVLVFQAIQDLIGRHPGEVIDFGYGDNLYKRVLAMRQAPCGSLYLVRGIGIRARFGLITPLRWIYRRLRWVRKSLLAKGAH